ncbi:peptide-N(4)-(N-acetyl-beta-glucosaminyl)asparagine amidase isoform X2 [Gymnodraco acuticeps]|uniref:Peptide-N(4)-(N-acetyl-beta-glucosaminyl)asparagine amidase n=1 Tax=Gymnodraco acuticeps TaxID=8218 RepID=A0A6P8TZF4_GYMAC|nr:peptide-N(4)-(N-acetyl-beta-glucosaminyl)asparagine amidase isoform X2 [Gymnodraco acuticeps]
MSVSPAVTTLCENSDEAFLDAAKLLLTYSDNIMRFPNEEKYRSIRIGNPTFSTKLLPIKGAVECLFEMGFEEAETHLVFPRSASVDQMKLIRDSIAAERDRRLGGRQAASPITPTTPTLATTSPTTPTLATTSPTTPTLATTSPTTPSSASAPVISAPPPPQPSSLENSMNFFATLQSNFQHVLLYENLDLQQKALSRIPEERLRSEAEVQLRGAREEDPDCKLGLEDFLVLELLRWFKQDFFSWVDHLPCSRCSGATQNSNPLQPSAEDLRWGAQRVENHYCHTCRLSTRFPRYNNPEKLLETRRGRCGEWANCFTLCCRAMGLEARYIWDSTDHVWTEVFSTSQRRWLHCDSCENGCDKPLLYEVGWGKKLAYILAFSKDQVVDVTWRYSCKHPEVLSRRTKVQESWLLHTIHRLNTSRQQSLSPERKTDLTERLLVELVEFLSPKKPKSGELGGRNSGSLAWRRARGETRKTDAGTSTETQAAGFVFTLTEKERKQKLLHVRYSSSRDEYCRLSNDSERIQIWDQCVWSRASVCRKVEEDWQMVYLARTEGSSSGKVSWKFDFSSAGMKVSSVSVSAKSETFHSGSVCWTLQAGERTAAFTGDGKMQDLPSVSGCSEFIIEAGLSGGEEETAWQHSQIFRQSLKETEEPSFEILVHLEDA